MAAAPHPPHAATAPDKTLAARPTLRVKDKCDFSETWSIVETNVEAILRAPEKPPAVSVGKLNSMVYRMAVGPCVNVPDKPHATDTAAVLYVLLNDTLKRHLGARHNRFESNSCFHQAMIDAYVDEWKNFERALLTLSSVFSYVHNAWRFNTPQNLVHTRQMGLAVWREKIFAVIREKLITALLWAIDKDRAVDVDSHTPDDDAALSQVKIVLTSFTQLSPFVRRNLYLYTTNFEANFLRRCEELFTSLASQLFSSDLSSSEKLLRTRRMIESELARAKHYLEPAWNTENQLKSVLFKTVVESRLQVVVSPLDSWLANDKQFGKELRNMFWLVSQTQSGLDPFRKKFEDVVDQEGQRRLDMIAQKREPFLFAATCVEVFNRFQTVVEEYFGSHGQLNLSLREGAARYVNQNKACDSATTASYHAARYANSLLRSKEASGSERHDEISSIVTLVLLLEDKDAFKTRHAELLAKRLIGGFADVDDERELAGKLRQLCGNDFTYKWERMLNDDERRNHACDLFQQQLATSNAIETVAAKSFRPLVLAHGSWPVSTSAAEARLPCAALDSFCRLYEQFYCQSNARKKLTWLHTYDVGTVTSLYANVGHKAIEITVNRSQLAILLQFNTQSSVSLSSLRDAGLDESAINRAIEPLVQALVLIVSDSAITLNLSVAEDRKRKLPPSEGDYKIFAAREQATVESAPLNETAPPQVEASRKLTIQASIMKVMKGSGELSTSDLILEVVGVLRNRFLPSEQAIRQNVDQLAEKEFLEKLPEDRVRYLAV